MTSRDVSNRVGVVQRLPWLSIGLAVVFASVFALELRYPATPALSVDTPSLPTLLAFGAMNTSRVIDAGEWYRLCTASLLHASSGHVFFNGVSLLLAGLWLEPVLGRSWLLTACCAGGLGASLLGFATMSGQDSAVGASGAIMGVFSAGFFASFRLPYAAVRKALRIRTLFMLLPTLALGLIGLDDVDIDTAGHCGGTLGGALVGLAVWNRWPVRDWAAPPSRLAVTLATSGTIVFLLASGLEAWAWQNSIFRHLAPSETQVASKAEVDLMVQTYPADPAGWVARGRFMYQARDYVAAEQDFRTGLKLAVPLSPVYPPYYQTAIRGLIAMTLSIQGRDQDALEMARPACQSGASDGSLLSSLQALKLCSN